MIGSINYSTSPWQSGATMLLCLVLLSACGTSVPTPSPVTPVFTDTPVPVSTPAESAYPGPLREDPAPEYPPPSTPFSPAAAYPEPEDQAGTLLALNIPIEPGAISVTGVGPPGLVVHILNITFMGEQIGSGVIDNSGRFSIRVQPLEANTRIGLTADLGAHGLNEQDIRFGAGAMTVPQVGHFYDSYLIAAP
jgi:hypothetical protein